MYGSELLGGCNPLTPPPLDPPLDPSRYWNCLGCGGHWCACVSLYAVSGAVPPVDVRLDDDVYGCTDHRCKDYYIWCCEKCKKSGIYEIHELQHQVLGPSDKIAQSMRQSTRQSVRREEFIREKGESLDGTKLKVKQIRKWTHNLGEHTRLLLSVRENSLKMRRRKRVLKLVQFVYVSLRSVKRCVYCPAMMVTSSTLDALNSG